MEVDPEYLRRHYASLSDEGLAEIDRAELVDAARRRYDDEVGQRRLKARVDEVELPASQPGRREEEFPVSSGAGEIPEWAGEGAEVFSVSSIHGPAVAEDAERARRVLAAAGIPCYLDTYEDPPDEGPALRHTSRHTSRQTGGESWFRGSSICGLPTFWTAIFSTMTSRRSGGPSWRCFRIGNWRKPSRGRCSAGCSIGWNAWSEFTARSCRGAG